MKKIITIAIMGIILTSCASKTVFKDPEPKSGEFYFWPVWIKDKKARFDSLYTIKNLTDKHIIIFTEDINCKRSEAKGSIIHKTKKTQLALRPQEFINLISICKLGKRVQGEMKISITKIYDNPSKDGRTIGKVIQENVVWTRAD